MSFPLIIQSQIKTDVDIAIGQKLGNLEAEPKETVSFSAPIVGMEIQ